MKLALMQPYFFPYIGYFQLIHAADIFIAYDTVNYIKNGWIKRNQYLLEDEVKYFTLSIKNASSNKLIKDTFIADENEYHSKERIVKTIQMAYSKAPFFKQIFPFLENLILNAEQNIAKYNTHNLREICHHLNINTKILSASNVLKPSLLTGQDRVIEICEYFQTDEYINPIGGLEIYDRESFEAHNIHLSFLKTNENLLYHQWDESFHPHLSIIDVLMFNHKEKILGFLEQYQLI